MFIYTFQNNNAKYINSDFIRFVYCWLHVEFDFRWRICYLKASLAPKLINIMFVQRDAGSYCMYANISKWIAILHYTRESRRSPTKLSILDTKSTQYPSQLLLGVVERYFAD